MFKVLVMCQRKKSYVYEALNEEDAFAVDITVKKLEKYIYDYYRTKNVIIEYLTEYRNKDQYDADYKMTFHPASKNTEIRLKSYEFIRDHTNDYDMVMLQTCPLMFFTDNFKYLPWILKSDGVLSIKAFNQYYTDSSFVISKLPPDVYEILMKYFDNIDKDTFKIRRKED